MSPTTLRCTVDGPVATITLARPERMNAFNATMHAELRDALDQCEGDDTVRVVVLTGEGRAFSSGQDLTVDLTRDAQHIGNAHGLLQDAAQSLVDRTCGVRLELHLVTNRFAHQYAGVRERVQFT